MSIPSSYPSYISSITDKQANLKWRTEYLNSYRNDYLKEANGYTKNVIYAVMSSVAIFALTLFRSIVLFSNLNVHAIAASLSLFAVGTAAAACAGLYFGWLSERNAERLKELPQRFPMVFQLYFDQKMLEQNQKV